MLHMAKTLSKTATAKDFDETAKTATAETATENEPMNSPTEIIEKKDTDNIIIILKHIIRTAANDHTGFLISQLSDDFCLIVEKIICRQEIIAVRRKDFFIANSFCDSV